MTLPPVTIYTDGGCIPNPGPGGWAALLIAEDGRARELSGSDPDTTNNRMELTAAVEALRALPRPSRVTFYTDSQYVRNGITSWLPGWVANGWQRKGKQPVKNQDLWEALHAETRRHQIDWRWVRGHAGNRHNERVDRLATAARAALTGPAAPPEPAALPETQYAIALGIAAVPGKGRGGWAAHVEESHSDQPAVTLTGHDESATAYRLELIAALAALRQVPPGSTASVFCPSEYLFNGMTQWIIAWQRRGWTTANGQPVKHRNLWESLQQEAQQRQLHWLRGTPPALANDLDRLADDAARG